MILNMSFEVKEESDLPSMLTDQLGIIRAIARDGVCCDVDQSIHFNTGREDWKFSINRSE